jgi:hypothetical protein
VTHARHPEIRTRPIEGYLGANARRLARPAAVLAVLVLAAAAASGCSSRAGGFADASGTIVYVEAVDPDGDGDAHFVLLDRNGVTAPGITVVDVRRELRPHPLPGIGERLSASGPVRTGSFGQRQIEATEVRVPGR